MISLFFAIVSELCYNFIVSKNVYTILYHSNEIVGDVCYRRVTDHLDVE